MAKNPKSRFTMIIADDHPLVRSGLRDAIATPGAVEQDGLDVVAEAENGLEAIEVVKREGPDLLLLDISMPLASGAEILTDIKRWSPKTKIVIMTALTAPGLLASLVAAEVDGLFSKDSNTDELVEKLPLILRGGRHVAQHLVAVLRGADDLPSLTQREHQTLNMIVVGKTNAEIANHMGISPKTAEKHRTSLMQKMGARSAIELMGKALKYGLIDAQNVPD